MQRQELLHIVLAELVAALMLIWLAVEAVYHENAFELLASAVVICCISARLIYFIVSFLYVLEVIILLHSIACLSHTGQCCISELLVLKAFQFCIPNQVHFHLSLDACAP